MFHKKNGFINLILLIIVAILVLSYYGFDLRGLVTSPQTQKNFQYIKDVVSGLIAKIW